MTRLNTDATHGQEGIVEILKRLERIESALQTLVREKTVKEHYSTLDVAEILQKAEFTVREWCRMGRIRARKRPSGRGRYREWMISHVELVRLQNEGLLPVEHRVNGDC